MHTPRSLAIAFLIAGCSDDSSPVEPEEPADVLDARVVEPVRDAGRPPRDASGYTFDARTIIPPKECTPGRYEGEFLCAIAGIVPWFGRMQFELLESEMGAGEFTTLSVAAGTRITSDLDSMGGTFSAELNASFDCRTGVIEGELKDGVYLLGGLMPWNFGGPLQGGYRLDDAGVPGFDGTLGTLTTPDLWFYGPLAPTGMCEWNTSRVSDAADAGP